MSYNFDNREVLPIEAIVENLMIGSTMTERKIIVFEMIRLAVVDNVFHESEKTMIDDLARQFGIEESYVTECRETIESYVAIEEKMNLLVLN